MNNSLATTLAAVAALGVLAGCSQKSADPEPAATSTEPAAASAAPPAIERTPSPAEASLYFVTPMDGDQVTSPVTVEFGLEGMAVVKAGVEEEHSGHHHLIINAELPSFDLPIPATENYIHFGDASTSTTVELPPGEHRLQLLLGDFRHVPHDPPVLSEVITITVLESAQ